MINYSQDSPNSLLEDYRLEQIEEDSMLLSDAKHIFSIIKNMQFVSGGSCIINDKDVYTFGKGALIRSASPKSIETAAFYISRFLITREQWQAVMGKDHDPSEYSIEDKNLPVYKISYEDCQRFIVKLNRITGLHFSLPSSEQWDYAARGGNNGQFDLQGMNRDEIDKVSWYNLKEPMPVGCKLANPLGLFDMYGNVGEYCLRQNDKEIIKGGYIFGARVNQTNGFYHYEDYITFDDKVLSDDVGLRLVIN